MKLTQTTIAMLRFCCLLLALSGLLVNPLRAQNGVFQVRLTLNKADCGNRKLLVDVEIKAQNATSSFLMGNANLRFLYDARQLQHPVLVEQHNFSSVGKAADLNYNPQTLNGSAERLSQGIVSLNVLYSGAERGAKRVEASWVPVASIQFDLLNPQADVSTALTWNDDKTFPVTGMNEVVLRNNATGVDAYVAKAGGVFQNLEIRSVASICSGPGGTDQGELMIPEGFSPNGDGINDRFVLFNLGALKADLTVYNLSGAIVFSRENYQNDWDGQTAQGLVASGTYFYSVRLSDGRSLQRSMTISR